MKLSLCVTLCSDKRRHFIFWLKSLTNDQRDALMQIDVKSPSSSAEFKNGKFCTELKVADARLIFVSILRSIRCESKILAF